MKQGSPACAFGGDVLGGRFRAVPLDDEFAGGLAKSLTFPVEGLREQPDECGVGQSANREKQAAGTRDPKPEQRRHRGDRYDDQGGRSDQDGGVAERPAGHDGVVQGDRASDEHGRRDPHDGFVEKADQGDAGEDSSRNRSRYENQHPERSALLTTPKHRRNAGVQHG